MEEERVQKAHENVKHAKEVSERNKQGYDQNRDESMERLREKQDNAERARQEQVRENSAKRRQYIQHGHGTSLVGKKKDERDGQRER